MENVVVEKILVKPETAERLRKAAPVFGLKPGETREMDGDLEVIRMDPALAYEFNKRRKAEKISADAPIARLLKGL